MLNHISSVPKMVRPFLVDKVAQFSFLKIFFFESSHFTYKLKDYSDNKLLFVRFIFLYTLSRGCTLLET